MHALAKFGLATVLVTLAVLSNVLVTLSALSDAHAQIQGRQPEALYWQTFLVPEFGTTVEYPAGAPTCAEGALGNRRTIERLAALRTVR